MSKITDYRVGLVMGRAGINEAQTSFLRWHLHDIARTISAPVGLVVPVIPVHRRGSDAPRMLAERARSLVQPLVDALPWLKVDLIEHTAVDEVVPRLLELDEVHCATCRSSGSEFHTRPAHIYQRAQGHPRSVRFRWLHYWVELDPRHLPSQETKKGKNKKPAMKGW